MRVGFIGLGNVGGKLAGSVLRNGYNLTVLDLDESVVATFAAQGAKSAATPRELASGVRRHHHLPSKPGSQSRGDGRGRRNPRRALSRQDMDGDEYHGRS